MGRIFELNPAEQERVNTAYDWMENERVSRNEEIIASSYSTITDYYVPFDMHIAFFYDTKDEKLYVRTYIYASGVVTYEEIREPERLVNESEESRTIAWMLLRTGLFLCSD